MSPDMQDPDMVELHAWAARELAKIELPPLTTEQARLIELWPRRKAADHGDPTED